MIITRAPLRISFVGGGTDLKAFYSQYPGRVISTTIDKYVYIAVKPDMLNRFIMKYHLTEEVRDPRQLEHARFREALFHAGAAEKGLEIASFADVLARTGLGSSSSFSVALMAALYAYTGTSMGRQEIAEAASHLEINILNEPIGKQDQYAAAFGGFNIFQFNADESVDIEPVFLDFKTRSTLEQHMVLYFTGITRDAAAVLSEQESKIAQNLNTYKAMSDSVYEFRDLVLAGDMRGVARMLHDGWTQKKGLATAVTTSTLDTLYEGGIAAGAWGGKVLGAGGGGCLLFIAPPERHAAILETLQGITQSQQLTEAQGLPFRLCASGVDVLLNTSWV